MLKKLLFIIALTAIVTQAVPIKPGYLTGMGYSETDGEVGVLTDTDGDNDKATFFLLFEGASYADNNSFGIYEFEENSNGDIIGINQLEVFSGGDDHIHSAALFFESNTGSSGFTATNSTGLQLETDGTFGFYIKNEVDEGGFTYYSHSKLNPYNYDHFKAFNTNGNDPNLFCSDVVLAIEDSEKNGVKDFDDMVIGISQVVIPDKPSRVPEPGIISLFGLSIVCFAGYRRRRK